MNTRIAQVEALLDDFAWEVEHCRQVRDLAVAIFDELRPLHGLGDDERDVLDAAALLHDIGWTASTQKHHKHSYRLIGENSRTLAGFSAGQVELIANVARYHRKSAPSLKHEAFAGLTREEQEVVRKLSALLRIADGLDRPHLQAVRKLRCELTEDVVRVQLEVALEPGLHIEGARRKKELFEAVFGVPVEFSIL